MHCLAKYLPLLIGDKIEDNNEFWELFIMILAIYKIVTASSIIFCTIPYVQARIKDHLELFLHLFPENHLIPKFHNLVHYHRAIELLGPLYQYSCMQHEGKHKPLKAWARNCNNYKKVARTLAKKYQEAQAFRYLKKQPIDSKSLEIVSQDIVKISELQNDAEVCNTLGCTVDTEIALCGIVEINTYKFRPSCMVMTKWNAEMPTFGRIDLIVGYKCEIYFLVQPWSIHYYDQHNYFKRVLKRPFYFFFRLADFILNLT